MSRENFSTFRAFAESGRLGAGPSVRAFRAVASQPSWVVRSALMAAAAVLVAIMLVVIVPVLVVMLAVLFAGMAVTGVRRWFAGLRRPNGVLDGRRNVRVIERRGE